MQNPTNPTLQKTGVPVVQQTGVPVVQQTTTVGQTIVNPPQTIVHSAIVQETVRNDKIIEVQPVVHREVDKNVVHHIEKHIQEAPAPNMGGVIEKNAIVQQQVHTNVVNEIQPVIHRERVVPVTERVEQHLQQRVVEPTVHTHEVIYETAPNSGVMPVGGVMPAGGVMPMGGAMGTGVPLAGAHAAHGHEHGAHGNEHGAHGAHGHEEEKKHHGLGGLLHKH